MSNPTSEAVNAAITIIENFSGIFLPGITDIMHPKLRLGLHAGKIVLQSHVHMQSSLVLQAGL